MCPLYVSMQGRLSHICICEISGASIHFLQFSSVAQLCPTLCDPMNTRPPCPSPTARVYTNSCRLSSWCHPTISSSVFPFSSCPQSFPASGSFPMSQLFTWGGQSTGVSASTSILPMNNQDWSLGWTGWIFLQSKGLSRVFSNTTVHFLTLHQHLLVCTELWWMENTVALIILSHPCGCLLGGFYPEHSQHQKVIVYLLCLSKQKVTMQWVIDE